MTVCLLYLISLLLQSYSFFSHHYICFPICHKVKLDAFFVKRLIIFLWVFTFLLWVPVIVIYPHTNHIVKAREKGYRINFYQENVPITAVSSNYFQLYRICTYDNPNRLVNCSLIKAYQEKEKLPQRGFCFFEIKQEQKIVIQTSPSKVHFHYFHWIP